MQKLQFINKSVFLGLAVLILSVVMPLSAYAATSSDGNLTGPDSCLQGVANGFGCNAPASIRNHTGTDAYSVVYYVSGSGGNALSACHGYQSGMIYDPTGSPLGTPACIGNYHLRGAPNYDIYNSDLYFTTDVSSSFDLTAVLTTGQYGTGSVIQSSTLTVPMNQVSPTSHDTCSVSFSDTTFTIGQETTVTMTLTNNTGSTLTYNEIGTLNGSRVFGSTASPAPSETDEPDKTSYFNWGDGVSIPDGSSATYVLDVKPVYDWNGAPIAPGIQNLYAAAGQQDPTKPPGNVIPSTYKYCTAPSLTLLTDESGTPSTGTPIWTNNPMATNQTATVSIPVSDSYNGYYGIVKGEYYLGAIDPGQDNGTTMVYNPATGSISASFSSLSPGIYTVNFRVKDRNGRWSSTITDYLVVYSSTTSSAAGHKNNILPVYGTDDLPGLIQGGQTDKAVAAFSVKVANGQVTSSSKVHLDYDTGTNCGKAAASNCHNTSLDSTSLSFMTIGGINNSTATIQGVATLTIDGVTTTNPFRLIVTDGSLLDPSATDQFELLVYAPGANPNTAAPIYKLNEPVAKGSITVKS